LRRAAPEFLGIVKNTSLALTIGVLEITASSRQVESYTGAVASWQRRGPGSFWRE